MTLTTDQARKIADITGWQQAGNMGGCYVDTDGNGTLIHGVVQERGFFDLLRVCEEREVAVRLYMDTGQILIEYFNHQARLVRHKFSTFHTHNDIPTALALAILEALEV